MPIKFEGLDNLMNLGNEIRESFDLSVNLRGSEREIARIKSNDNRKQFDNESSPDGRKWQQRKIKSSRPLLVDSGKLRQSLLSPDVNISGNGRTLTIRYSGDHAFLQVIHSAGAPSRGLPSRPVGGLSREAGDLIVEVAFRKVTDSFGKRLKEGKRTKK
jgi:phage gpG-like protein